MYTMLSKDRKNDGHNVYQLYLDRIFNIYILKILMYSNIFNLYLNFFTNGHFLTIKRHK